MPHTPEHSLKGLFGAAGIPWGFTPEQEFRTYAEQQFRPGAQNRLRQAFYDIQQPLLQQWRLAQPRMTGLGGTPSYGGFGDFMRMPWTSGAPERPWDPYGGIGLRGQAVRAAMIAGMPTGQFFEYVDPGGAAEPYTGPEVTAQLRRDLDVMTPAEQLLYRQTYGTGEEAAGNQLQLANLMALQQSGGGMYGGAMGGAISSALGELQRQLTARDPGRNFLDWYLARTEGSQGLGGFLSSPLAPEIEIDPETGLPIEERTPGPTDLERTYYGYP